MLHTAIIPERDRVFLPREATDELRPLVVVIEEFEDRLALLLRQPDDVLGELLGRTPEERTDLRDRGVI